MLAVQHGARAELSPQEVEQIEADPHYPGWYQDGQIIVDGRDLVGVSGTKGQEARPGFAHAMRLIEKGWISEICVVDGTRLFREQYLTNAMQFAKLCAEKGVYVITENMICDLANDMHGDMFTAQAQFASRELRMIMDRMGGARQARADSGRYAGDAVPVGYVVSYDEESRRFNDCVVHEP